MWQFTRGYIDRSDSISKPFPGFAASNFTSSSEGGTQFFNHILREEQIDIFLRAKWAAHKASLRATSAAHFWVVSCSNLAQSLNLWLADSQ